MFWENFTNLCVKIGKSPNAVAKELALSSGSITSWKNGAIPHDTTLIKIANYFGVPVSYFTEEHTTDVGTVHDNHGFIGNNHATVNINNNLPESNLGEIEKELLAVCQKLDTKRKAALLVKAYELLEQ